MSFKLIFRGIFSEETESDEFQTQWLISANELDSTRNWPTRCPRPFPKFLLKLNGALWYSASTTRCSLNHLKFAFAVLMSTTLVFLGLALSSLALWYFILHNRGLPWFNHCIIMPFLLSSGHALSLIWLVSFVVSRSCVLTGVSSTQKVLKTATMLSIKLKNNLQERSLISLFRELVND